MNRILFWLLAVILLCAVKCHAQTGVDESAKREVLRRGSHVELTGTVRSGLVAKALAPPADDSGKWFLTLVGVSGESQFEAMRQMIASNKEPELLAWVDPGDPQQSTTHYQVRNWDTKGTQQDWLVPLEPLVERYGLPMLVVQPPRSGQFGDASTIVKTLHGVMDQQTLSERLRAGVITYVTTIDRGTNPLVRAGEYIRSSEVESGDSTHGKPDGPIGVAPPFNVEPKPAPNNAPNRPNNPLPFEFPPAAPPAPPALTIDQIRSACPGSTAEFVLEVLATKETNLDIVKLRWEVALAKQERLKPIPPPVPEPPPTPPPVVQAPVVQPTPSPPQPALVPEPDPVYSIVRPRSIEPPDVESGDSTHNKPNSSFCLPAIPAPNPLGWGELGLVLAAILVGRLSTTIEKWIARKLAADTRREDPHEWSTRMVREWTGEPNPWTEAPTDTSSPTKPASTVNMSGVPPARSV